MSQPEEAQSKTSKTDDVLRHRPAAPPVGGPALTGGGTAPVDADARAREIAHADEQAEEAEAGSQEVS
ncbi:MAG: hypothetical protein V7603_4385 [Micromonosporaceae bacterium]|jgi:hypothetical protein